VVIPVYGGEKHLAGVVAQLEPFTHPRVSSEGHAHRVTEVVLVHDCGPDDSPRVMRELAATYDFVRPVWLSRNFGQHAATLAGIASSGGDWVVTMDEDGQHDPAYIADMLDTAMRERASVVYAAPTNTTPHSRFRNLTSRGAKRFVDAVSDSGTATQFHSYRLVLGEVGRSLAAYAGAGVFLDVALGWVVQKTATCPVVVRDEGERQSGYSVRRLLGHFRRMVLTAGTRGLRLVSAAGLLSALVGVLVAAYLVVRQLVSPAPLPGWTSLAVLVLISTGAVLFSLGVIAEYIGVTVNAALGKPLYLVTQDPDDGPLGRGRTE
jgi:undecaprenyl-phosphate 4-deoxy-4-formamido-L-arabinose transferase